MLSNNAHNLLGVGVLHSGTVLMRLHWAVHATDARAPKEVDRLY